MSEKYLHLKKISNSNFLLSWDIPTHIGNLVEWYFNKSFPLLTKAIRIYKAANNAQGKGEYEQEIIIDSNQAKRTVKGLAKNQNYYAEAGIKLSNHHFFPIFRSNHVAAASPDSELDTIDAHPIQPNIPCSWSNLVSTYTYYAPNETFNDVYEQTTELFKLPDVRNAYRVIDNTRVIVNKNESRRILILSWEYPPHLVGGLSRHVQGLAMCLQHLNYKVHIITSSPNDAMQEEIQHGVQIYRVAPINEQDEDFLSWIGGLNLAILKKAIELDGIHRFHLIHAHDWLVGASAIVLRDTLRIPMLATIHATEYGRNNGIHTSLQKFIHEKEQQLVSQADTVIVCSEYMKRELNQVFHIDEDKKIHIIPNGTAAIKPVVDDAQILTGFPIQKNKRLIFSIGRIVKEKGFDTLIEAAEKIHKQFPDVYFMIAGKGPLLDVYRKRAERLQLQNYFYFIGYVTDEQRTALLNHCSLAVFPSRYEPFGIVALEAMQAGKPTIVSKTGGLKGIVQHKKSGMFMKPGCTESLIEQIIYLLENEGHSKQIGHCGKERVETIFSWKRVAKETAKVYEKLLIQSEKEY